MSIDIPTGDPTGTPPVDKPPAVSSRQAPTITEEGTKRPLEAPNDTVTLSDKALAISSPYPAQPSENQNVLTEIKQLDVLA